MAENGAWRGCVEESSARIRSLITPPPASVKEQGGYAIHIFTGWRPRHPFRSSTRSLRGDAKPKRANREPTVPAGYVAHEISRRACYARARMNIPRGTNNSTLIICVVIAYLCPMSAPRSCTMNNNPRMASPRVHRFTHATQARRFDQID